MYYLIYLSYFILFVITSLCLRSKLRFVVQSISLLVIILFDSYLFYLTILQDAYKSKLHWFPHGFRSNNSSVDLLNRSFFEHLYIHHYIYAFVVFMVLLNIFHFGSKFVDKILDRYTLKFNELKRK